MKKNQLFLKKLIEHIIESDVEEAKKNSPKSALQKVMGSAQAAKKLSSAFKSSSVSKFVAQFKAIASDPKVQAVLKNVVQKGTGKSLYSKDFSMSGKTGTAQVFGKNANGSLKADTSWFASFGPSQNPRYAVVMMVSQGGFGASVSGVGVRKIYETLFGVTGSRIDPAKAIFPDGKPPVKIPKISPATKLKEDK